MIATQRTPDQPSTRLSLRRGASPYYVLALLLVGGAALLRWAFPTVLSETPYLAFYPAVVAAAAFGGFGPGMLATLATAFCIDLVFDPTPWHFSLHDPIWLARQAVFLVGGIGTSVIAGMKRSAQNRERHEAAEKAEATEKLRESEEKFRGLVEHMRIAVGIVQGTRFVYANPYLAETFGYSMEELLSTEFAQLVHPAHREMVIDYARRRQLGEPVPENYEFLALTRSGEERWLDFWPARIIYRGKPAVIGAALDITERKRAETALRQSESFYRQTLESIPSMAFTTRPDGYCDYQSHQWVDYTGVPMDEHLGEGWNRLLHPDDQPRAFAAWRAAVEQKAPYDLEYRVRRHDGEYEWFKVAARPIRDASGQIVRWFGIATNIETLKRTEAALAAAKQSAEQAKATAEEASRAKDHFMAVLSHELRTPLTPVLATVSMLQEEPRFDEDTRQSLEMIHRNVEMEARLIDDLLDLTRIARGKVQLDKRPVELCTIIGRAVDVCRPDLEARRLHFGIDLGPAAPYWIEADVGRLQQVFWNLLKNAIKFTPHGGCVGIRCRPEGSGSDARVVAEVNDSGEGIDPEAMIRIFDAFEQARTSANRQFGGLGLGLTISKALVEMHGGTISAHSAGKGKGASFRLSLPLVAAARTGVAEQPSRPAAEARSGAPAGLRILFVEDHGDTARIMKRLLERSGHTVLTAGDVATAIELGSRDEVELLISDLGLPDGSGLDLIRELHRHRPDLRGIALSGYGMEKDLQRSRDAGFSEHLTKPVEFHKLQAAIERVTAAVHSSGLRMTVAETGDL